MAKAAVALVKEEPQLPAGLMDEFEQHAGEGVSTAREDTLIPLLAVLQNNSPQVSKRDPKYIDGAEAGDILLTNLNRYWKGEAGILFQPCAFGREFIEWRLRDDGGGFIGRHPRMPETAKQVVDGKNPQKQRWVMPSGTEIVDTRYHYGIILNGAEAFGTGAPLGPMQAVLALSSTGHTFSRQWMTQMSQLRLPGGKAAPARARQYLITTVPKSNAAGDWFGLKAEDRGWITDAEQFALGTALYQSIQEGSLQAATPDKSEHTEDEISF